MSLPARVNPLPLSPEMSSGPEVNAVHLGRLIRQAIEETRTPYKVIALAVGVQPSYLTAMLDGEKPWRLEQINALPDAVERVLAKLYAESLGLTVLEPDEDAITLGNLIMAAGAVIKRFQRAALPQAGKPIKAGMK